MTIETARFGSVNYDVYIDEAYALRILRPDPIRGSVFVSGLATSEIRAQFIIMATRVIDRINFIGEKTDRDQATEWPRTGIPNVANNVVPEAVKYATALLVGTLYTNNASQTLDTNAENIKSVKAGPVSVQFFQRGKRFAIPDQEALRILVQAGYVSDGAGAGSGGFSTGTDVKPETISADRTEGFY